MSTNNTSISSSQLLENRHVPKSVLKTSRKEIDDQKLQIHKQEKKGQCLVTPVTELPEDLRGYVFVVGALFQAEDKPQEDGTPLYTGDGMIYRLGFADGKAVLKTRIAKTPCYYADLATQLYLAKKAIKPTSSFAKQHPVFSYFSAFRNGGQSRYSIVFGSRNQLNTAFLRTKDRLLVTIDAGRPYELDPDTMELLEPVGSTSQWTGILPVVSKFSSNNIFDTYVNPAHPVVDVNSLQNGTDEFFTANYSTGYNCKFKEPVNKVIDWIGSRLQKKFGSDKEFGRFTYLIRYRFGCEQDKSEPQMERWRLVLPNGQPVLAEQSLHQLAITEKYIILADIAFKMEFSQIFSPFFCGFLRLGIFNKGKFALLGAWLYSVFLSQIKPLAYGILYIIKREDLDKEVVEIDSALPKLTVNKVRIPLEISHFAADYANTNNKITIHIGHSNGWDVTECITRYDKFVLSKKLRKDLEGMMSGTTDLGSLGRYEIDGETGEIKNHQLIYDSELTWSLSVYTHRNLCRDTEAESAKTVKNIYWMSWGFTWELIPQRIYDAYKSDNRRILAIEDLPDENKPVTLLRLDTEKMQIVDSYQFPAGCFACSPQFVPSTLPCADDVDDSIHGYIVCVVLSDSDAPEQANKSRDEFWVFHADNFNHKPIYRLSASLDETDSEPLNLALTLHSTWLPNIRKGRYSEKERRNQREKTIRHDYDSLLENKSETIKTLFNDIVYPNFIQQTLETGFEQELQAQK